MLKGFYFDNAELFQCGSEPLSQKYFWQMFLGRKKEAAEEELQETCSKDEDLNYT